GDGDDVLRIDASDGNIFPDNFVFNGGGPNSSPGDGLSVIGDGTTISSNYTPDLNATGNGTASLSDGTDTSTITFTGLEPIDFSGFVSTTLTLPGANDTLTLSNGTDFFGGGNDAIRVSGTSGDSTVGAGDGVAIEVAAFSNITTLVLNTVLSGGDGDDQITIDGGDNGHNITNLTIDTGPAGDDEIRLGSGSLEIAGTILLNTGVITDNSPTEPIAITAASGAFRARGGIGAGGVDEDIDVEIGNVAATTAAGDLVISHFEGVTVTTVDGLAGLNNDGGTNGDITFISTGVVAPSVNLTVSAPISNAGTGGTTLFANGNTISDELVIEDSITAAGGDITLVSVGTVDFNSTPIVSTTGAGNINVHAGASRDLSGVISLTAGLATADVTGGGDYALRTDEGNITITAPDVVNLEESNADFDGIGAAGNVIVTADIDGNGSGVIFDTQVGESPLVLGESAVFRSAGGIGGVSGIETAVNTLAVINTTSGNVDIRNSVGGLLTIGTVDGVVGAANSVPGGSLAISNASPLNIAANVTAAGAITLTASDSAAAGDDLTIAAGVTVESTGSSVTLQAGDNFADTATSSIVAASTIAINIDFGNADAGVGGTADLLGTFDAGTTSVTGNADDDVITIGTGSITGSLAIDGGAGNDQANLNAALNLAAAGAGLAVTAEDIQVSTGSISTDDDQTYTGTLTRNADLTLTGDEIDVLGDVLGNFNLTVNTTSATSSITGEVSGTGQLIKQNSGTLSLTDGANSYSGATTISAGTLALENVGSTNNIAASPTINVGSGATLDVSGLAASTIVLVSGQLLQGTGSVSGNTQALAGSAVHPGFSPGILTQNGNVTLDDNSGFNVEINGSTPGTEHSQLVVNGTVTINNADLNLNGTGLGLISGDTVVLIDNDGADAVVGNFEGLPEGTRIPNFLGLPLIAEISYAGGSGNDVVLAISSFQVVGSLPAATLTNQVIGSVSATNFYQITAHQTGKLIVNAFFDDDAGDVNLEIQDLAGNTIATANTATDNENLVIPVVGQEIYLLLATLSDDPDTTPGNQFSLEIENFAAPTPTRPDLVDGSDTGRANDDEVTADNTPTIEVTADLTDFANMGITIDSGAGVPGADVVLTATSQSTGVVTTLDASRLSAANNNLWTATFGILADGEYVIEAWVRVEDGAATPAVGRSPIGDPLTITIDTTAPSAPVGLDLVATSDDGVSSTDNITTVDAPAISGFGEPNTQVRLFANDVNGVISLVGQSTVTTSGIWEITSEPLGSGIYSFFAELEDRAGNISPLSIPLNDVIIDPLEPNETLATATSLGSPIATSLNGVVIHHDTDVDYFQITAHQTGKLIFNTTATGGAITAEVRDSADNVLGTGANVVIPVVGQEQYFLRVVSADLNRAVYDIEIENIAAPTPTQPDLVDASDTGLANDDNITADNTPTIEVTADLTDFANMGITIDGGAAAAGADVVLTATSQSTGVVTTLDAVRVQAANNNLWTATFGVLADDEYVIEAWVRVEDSLGVVGRSPIGNPLVITIDTTSPSAPVAIDLLEASDDGISPSDNVTSLRELAFTGFGEPNNLVRLFADGELVGQSTVTTFGLWQVTTSELADGAYDITAELEDLAGNISPLSIALEVTVDPMDNNSSIGTATVLGSETEITLNEVPLNNTADIDVFQITAHSTGKLIINAFFDDAGGDVNIEVQDAAGNSIASSSSTTDDESLVIPVVSQENYFLFVTLADDPDAIIDEGNLYDLEIENFAAPVPTQPDLVDSSDTGRANDDNITADNTPTIEVTADLTDFANMGITIDGGAGVPGADVVLTATSQTTGAVTTLDASRLSAANNNLWTGTFGILADGEYVIEAWVRVEDGAATPAVGRSLIGDPITITIDTTAPAAP
ncbi:MAG: Ig-like domain-containing protein, partial [Pirellulales bacterium]|nr:Ig-like domain-containing protein [Pirellulales bacterium]